MPFTQGRSGNIKGRPQGSKNSRTIELQNIIISILEKSFRKTKIEKDIQELSPKQRLDYMLRLMEFILPKPKPEEITINKPETVRDVYNRLMPLLQPQTEGDQP
jgi:hypothetical protein